VATRNAVVAIGADTRRGRHGIGALLDALRKSSQRGIFATDEAMAMERMGHRPRLIEGPASNIKVTFPEDLTLAAWYLEQATEREP
jgi:2-C-methyl-D-erythritol 4-phosphate cytidylyltransferase